MSNIEIKSNTKLAMPFSICKNILQEKIDRVCSILGFDDSKIKWVIYNPVQEERKVENRILGINKFDYGYCNPSENSIFISTKAILENRHVYLLNNAEDDRLADVIIDEITHIQTGRDHGVTEYDSKLKSNLVKYYGYRKFIP